MSEFTDYLEEVFAEFGAIQARRMFGGYGIYHDGIMFALVADDTLYLKTDKTLEPLFRAQGLGPFVYEKQGKPVTMSYHLAPEEIYDDPGTAREWATRSFDAALRSRKT